MNFQATAGRCLWVVWLGRTVALLTVLAPASAVLGQGFILFNNRVPGILNAPVYNLEPSAPTTAKTGNTPAGLPAGTQTYDGPLVAGTGFTAQLWAGPLGTPDSGLTLAATNLMVFFARHGKVKSISSKADDYVPGDIVCWNLGGEITHIGIVVNKKSTDGKRYLIVHNIGGGQVLADCLFEYKIIGHYQYKK